MTVAVSPSPASPGVPPTDNRIDRIAAVGAWETLERIRASPLIAEGAVNMLGLDAIRAKLGDRWPAKRARVWEHVERELERRLTPADISVRVDDVSYLVAMASAPGYAAQGVCLTILQDVLKYFLGELRPADVLLRGVTAIGDGEIASAPVDPIRMGRAAGADRLMFAAPQTPTPETPAARAAEAVNGPLAEHAAAPKPWKPPLAGRSATVSLAPPKREPFDLKLGIEPVWNLKRGLITSFLIDRAGAPAQAQAADLEEIDVATCAYAVSLMQEHRDQGGPLLLHMPVSFTSLATQRSRERIMRLTAPVREAMRGTVLLEICGLDGGVPPSRLIEVVGLVRSLCAGVLGRARPNRSALEAVRGCGLRGVVLEAAQLGASDLFGARLEAYAHVARDVAANMIVHGLPTNAMVDRATSAGFSHASVARDAP
jgi:hypothetical protein